MCTMNFFSVFNRRFKELVRFGYCVKVLLSFATLFHFNKCRYANALKCCLIGSALLMSSPRRLTLNLFQWIRNDRNPNVSSIV